MKKIFLSTLILVTLTTAAFASEKNPNRKLLSDLTIVMKGSSLVTKLSTKNERITFKSFDFNGKFVSACYQDENELIGFTVPFAKSELPAPIAESVSRKYNDWNIEGIILLIDADANANYFIQIKKGNNNLAIKANSEGHTSIYSKM